MFCKLQLVDYPGWEHPGSKRAARFLYAQVIAYRTLMDKRQTYLFGLPRTTVPCNILVLCRGHVHGRNLQLHVDENECMMQSYLYAYANAHEMRMQ